MAIGNMHKKFGKDRASGSGDMLADRQTDTHTHTQTTDALITILLHHSCGRSNYTVPDESRFMFCIKSGWTLK